MKKLLIILSILILTSCQKNVLTNIAKTDIDIVTEIHINYAKGYIEDLIIKLYRVGNKNWPSTSGLKVHCFGVVE